MEKTTRLSHLSPRLPSSTHFPLRAKIWAHVKGRERSAKTGRSRVPEVCLWGTLRRVRTYMCLQSFYFHGQSSHKKCCLVAARKTVVTALTLGRSWLLQCTPLTAIKTAQVGTKAILPPIWYPLCHCQLLSSCAILQKAPTQNILYLNINTAISIHGREVGAVDSQRPLWFTCEVCMPISLVFPMNSYYLPIYTQIHHQRGGSCANNEFLHCL